MLIMYIYQIYKTKKDLQDHIKNNKLHKDYYFAFKNSIYKMIDENHYVRLNYYEFENDYVKSHIEKMVNLKYEEGDIIKIIGNRRDEKQ